MRRLAPAWEHIVDVRHGEGRMLLCAGSALFLIVAAHTMLETARDALLLRQFPAEDLGLVYVVVALSILPAAALAARYSQRVGAQRMLVAGLGAVALALSALFFAPVSAAASVAIYVASGLISGVLLPLFWSLLGGMLTVAQGRRLVGAIGAAGVLASASGSAIAMVLIRFIPVTALLLVSAVTLAAGAITMPKAPPEGTLRASEPEGSPSMRSTLRSLWSEPFVPRIALLIGTATAVFVMIDVSFKWAIARSVPPDRVPSFMAEYYVVLNGAALVAQFALGRSLVRRFGVAATLLVTPLILMIGTFPVLLTGGALVAFLVSKGLDGVLRNSVYRMTNELIYLPLAPSARMRAKPLIDGALARTVQVSIGAALFGIGEAGYLSAPVLAGAVGIAAALWLAAAWTTRKPYLALLRRAIASPELQPSTSSDPLDLESAEALVENLSDEDPRIVVGAINALARRGRFRLVPALILLHGDESVLARSLALFGASSRKDWILGAHRLLADQRESVSMAAVRALAVHGRLDTSRLALDPTSRACGYALVHKALEQEEVDPAKLEEVCRVLDRSASGEQVRLGMLYAIADAPENPRLRGVLDCLSALHSESRDWTVELARACASQRALHLIPLLTSFLTSREGREVVRASLVSFGGEAIEALRLALKDPASPRAVRIHIPNTLVRFGNKEAAQLLLETIEIDLDGLVRYKAVRALGRLAAEQGLKMDRIRVERLALNNLLEHIRLLTLSAALGPPAQRDPSETLLRGLISDKLHQSLERTFRLLKISHPHEDIHRAHLAYVSGDGRMRANAAELFDALLRRHDQQRLRELLHIAADGAAIAESLGRLPELVPFRMARTREEALEMLTQDHDATMSALATLHGAFISGRPAHVLIGSRERPSIEIELKGENQRAIDG